MPLNSVICSNDNILIIVALFIAATLSIITRKLTVAGGITGFIVALLIFAGAGYTGIAMLAAFFLLGTLSTKWGLNRKQQLGAADKKSSRRNAYQVLANAGCAAAIGLFAYYQPGYIPACRLMIAGSLAAATADTLSSELGTIYGKRFYDIITLKKSHAGPDGVVSIEGTLTGICGAVVIAFIYQIAFGFNDFLFVIIAGACGNLADSILGATLERKHIIGNNMVNFLNTCIGASICLLLKSLIK